MGFQFYCARLELDCLINVGWKCQRKINLSLTVQETEALLNWLGHKLHLECFKDFGKSSVIGIKWTIKALPWHTPRQHHLFLQQPLVDLKQTEKIRYWEWKKRGTWFKMNAFQASSQSSVKLQVRLSTWLVQNCDLPYLSMYNAHFFPAEKALKIEMHIIHRLWVNNEECRKPIVQWF